MAAARVSIQTQDFDLAAEVAATYVGLRSCEAVLAVYEEDAASLQQTADIHQLDIGLYRSGK